VIDRLHDLVDRFVLTLDDVRGWLHDRLSGVRRIGSLMVAAVVVPIEWLIGLCVGLVAWLFEKFDFVEEALGFLVFIAVWPFQKAAELLGLAAARVAPKTALGALEDDVPEGALEGGLDGAMWKAAERLHADRAIEWITWLTYPLWGPVAAIIGFVRAWMVTRPIAQLLWGLPTLLVLGPILGAVVWGAAFGRDRVTASYKEEAAHARVAKDFETVSLMERKLAQLGVESSRNDYQIALDLAEDGDLEAAYKRIQELAPEESAGFPQAHLWIVLHLLEKKLDVPDEDRLRLAEVHLEHLKSLGFRGEQFDALRRNLLVQGERWEELADMLEPLLARSLEAATARLEIDLMLNRPEEARRDARAVCTLMQEAQRRGEKPTTEQYRVWAVAESLVGDRLTQGFVLRGWLETDPENADARTAVVALAKEEFNVMLQSAQPNTVALGERIVEITRLTGQPKEVAQQIAQLIQAANGRPTLLATLEQVVATPDVPLGLLAAIGTLAEINGHVELARDALTPVVEGDPNHAIAWNNLAWALAQEPDADLDAALAAANRALELMPNQSRFLETRGQIYVSLGMWAEAVADLEVALNGMPNTENIHASLAAAYDALGQSDMAAIHRRQMR
jgi:tetratricopeptide (TPR) repeat protein